MNRPQAKTFGTYIAEARKAQGKSQKDLAGEILREEDGNPISPQYLNDIERDRRSPSSDHLIAQFARVLGANADYLHYLAGQVPADLRRNLSEQQVDQLFTAFRKKGK